MVGAEAASHRGLVRETNQDACCALVADTPAGTIGMAVVCDGVGGLEQGERASSHVVNRFAAWFEHELARYVQQTSFSVELLDTVWDDLIQSLHEDIRLFGVQSGKELGTTFTGVVVSQGRYLVAQVGDSRLYVLHDGSLSQITEDQTVAAQQAAAGMFADCTVSPHPCSNVILQAIGAGREVHPQFTCGACSPRDLLVLCTDGMYTQVSDDDMQACLARHATESEPNLSACCDTLLGAALAAGAPDNVTIACLFADSLLFDTHGTLVVGVD